MPRSQLVQTFRAAGTVLNGGDSHNGDGIVVKDGRDVFGGKLVGCIADEQTSLANSTVPNNHASSSIALAFLPSKRACIVSNLPRNGDAPAQSICRPAGED